MIYHLKHRSIYFCLYSILGLSSIFLLILSFQIVIDLFLLMMNLFSFFFKKVLIQGYVHCLEKDRKRARSGEGGRNTHGGKTDWLPPICATTGNQTHNLCTCLDGGWNPQTFGVQVDAPMN